MDEPIIYKGERIFPDGGKEVRGNCMVIVDNHVLPSVCEMTPFEGNVDVSPDDGYYFGEQEYEWGNHRSSAAKNLSKSILSNLLGNATIDKFLWLEFLDKFVYDLPFSGWELNADQIDAWLLEVSERI